MTKFLLCVCLLIGANGFVLAQGSADELAKKWRLPASPTGQRGAALLEALTRRDENYLRGFIEQNFAPQFLKDFSVEQHVKQLGRIQTILGEFELAGAEKTGAQEVEFLLQTKAGQRLKLACKLEAQPPHRIAGIGLEEAANAPSFSFTNLAELERYLTEQTAANRFSGVVVVTQNGQPKFERAYGLANKTKAVPNTVNTRFDLGSITKLMTKVAVYQLAEKGKLKLDDPLGKYLPQFPREIADKVTIRHLLDHRSGYGDLMTREFRQRRSEIRTIAAHLELLKTHKLQFEPGAQEQYSPAGYVILGGVIEAAGKQSFYDYLQQHIFKPAGMKDSSFPDFDKLDDRTAVGYTNERGGADFSQTNQGFHTIKGTPAGRNVSTAADLMKFDQALRGGKLLGAEPTKQLAPPRRAYAGGMAGVSAVLLADDGAGLTVVVLSNYDEPFGEQLGQAIFKMLRR